MAKLARLNPVRRLQSRLLRLEAEVRRLNLAVDALLVDREYQPSDDVGFNGQRARKKMFSELVAALHPDAIVETGTWTGNTTGYIAEGSTGLLVRNRPALPRHRRDAAGEH